MTPLVSILIPAHNAHDWIAETIESALAQTWPSKEIIVVDDGSRDGTLDVARRYESRQVRVFSQDNRGGAAARNTAYALSQGDYIQWLDADDLLDPGKIARQMEVADRLADPRMLLSSAWAYFTYRPSRARFHRTALCADLARLEWICRKWTNNLHMQTATWLVSRELTEAAGPWNTRLLSDDDGEYFTRVVLASSGVRFAPDARMFYRIVGMNRLSYIGLSNRKLDAHVESMRLQIGYVRAMDDGPQVRAAVAAYLQTWLPHFYPERPDLVRELAALGAEVGAELHVPRLSWKYAWIEPMFGRAAAKRVQLRYNERKTSVLRSWDRLVCELVGK